MKGQEVHQGDVAQPDDEVGRFLQVAAIVLDQLETVNRDGVVGLVGSLDTASPLTVWAFLAYTHPDRVLDFATFLQMCGIPLAR